ncbi:non-ribosomal peptide synthetase [Pseudonocardia sp. EC080625-04]|uniref:non-ribosomal peptide synthetase n=1 Tax=Pseudonocardia sp. EC080625-04 TaxID=1096868 RepID=UPI0009E92CA7|nr:non-ribosomal peptide synthetase [Pseudonocardia sp. EC080625-04]
MNGAETSTRRVPVLVPVDRTRRPGRAPRCSAAVRAGGFVRAPSGPLRDAIVLAGFAVLLYRYTGQTVVGLDRHGARGTERVEIDVRPNEALTGLANRSPLMAEGPTGPVGIGFETPDEPVAGDQPHELMLVSGDGTGGSVAFELHYDPALFDESTAARLLTHLTVLLADAAEHPGRPVSRLRLLTCAEQEQILVDWNRTAVDLPHDVCLHEAFERQSAMAPEAVAVRHEGRSWSYHQVEVEANRLAHHLRSLGVGPDVRVGLCLDRSPELLVGVLGIMKAGGAYVPIDPAYPAQRIATMVGGTSCAAMVSREELADGLPVETLASRPLLLLDRHTRMLAELPEHPPVPLAEPDDLCYVIHTSGSTGAPKPIALRHRGVMNNLADLNRRFDVGPGDAVLSLSSPSFDMSVYEFLGMAAAGGTTVVPDRARAADPAHWAQLIADEAVTIWNSAPALLGLLVEEREQAGGELLHDLRLALLGGDWVPVTLPARARAIAPSLQVIVMGGATEASIHSTITDATETDTGRPSIPYGHPMSNQRTYVLDGAGQPVPPGVAGELHLAGIGLARGYLDQPERTAERFFDWSYADVAHDRVYRTGDLARYDASGMIELLGRIDFQTKINGLRIEPGEIEAVLRSHPDVGQVAVVVRDGRLIAYLAPSGDAPADGQVDELRELAAERLPEFMIPAAFVGLDALPLTPNGKVDRAGLPAVDVPGAVYRAPTTPDEQIVADVFADVLGKGPVGADDDFVALGGDSIRSIQVVTRLRARGRDTTTQDVLALRTVTALAARLADVRAEPDLPTGPLVDADGAQLAEWRDRYPGFREAWPPTPMQSGMLFESMLNETGRDTYQIQTVYRIAGTVDSDRLRKACAALVARHSALRVAFTHDASDELVQIVVDDVEVPWSELDLTQLIGSAQNDAIARFLDSDRAERFDLAAPPLLRATLLRLGPSHCELVVSAHHALLDGWSEQLVGRELQELYAGVEVEPTRDFRDFMAWCARLDTANSRRAWAEELRGVGGPTLIAPAADVHASAETVSEIVLPDPATASRDAARACGELGVTVNTMVQAAWGVVLCALTGRDDVVFGATVSGRPAGLAGVESMIGPFINTVPVRVTPGSVLTVADLLVDLQRRQTALSEHHHHSLADTHRTCGVDTLFDTLVVFQSYPSGTGDSDGSNGSFTITGVESLGGVSFPLALLAEPDRIVVQFHPNRFGSASVDAIVQRFAAVLAQMVADPSRSIGSLDALLPTERSRYTPTHRPASLSAPRTLPPLVERYAAATPDVPAVVFGGVSLTYAELNARANRLAHELIGSGVGPGSAVGVVMPPSTQLTIAMVGVLKAGAAHVVVDPSDPRRDEILAAAGTVRNLGWLDVETSASASALDPTDEDRTSALHPLTVASIRFPDRCGDHPKGISVGHQVLAEEVLRYALVTGISPGARLVCGVSGDDQTAFEVLAGLCRGAVVELVRAPDGLGGPDLVADVLSTTAPRMAEELSRGTADGASIGVVVLAGDMTGGSVVPSALVHRIREAVPGTDVITTGGTSAVPYSLAGRAAPNSDPHAVPVGHPIGNQRVYVLDPALRPLPDGAIGELYVAGTLAQGYHALPGTTAEYFVADPWGPPGARMHRAGVLSRRDDSGRVEVLGRSTDRLTIAGHRFWPHEIEVVLADHPDVTSATVSDIDGRVLALVATRGPSADEAGIRAFAARHLPHHMVPDVAVAGREDQADTPSGGVEPLGDASVPHRDGRNERETALCAMFAEILGIERVGIDDNVLHLGVDSLFAGRMISRIRRTLGVKLPIRTLFRKPTVAELAAELSTGVRAPARPAMRRKT